MMNLRGLIICDEERDKKKKNKIDAYGHPYIPEEFLLENIVIRLSARDLAKWSCVSKYLYKSILYDSRFASSHFDHNKNKLNLVFNLLNVWIYGRSKAYFLSIEEKEEEEKDNGFLLNYRLLIDITSMTSDELVGYCNGLVCTKQVGNATADRGQITIANPTRREMLTLSYSTPTSSTHLCHGFYFDSFLQQYKVVFIYTTTSTTSDQEFVCMVLTFGSGGTNNTFSWRKIVTRTAEISPPPGSTSPFPGRMVTRSSRSTRRSATLCGVDLLWRITNCISDNDSKTDMLLSFNIHDEKIRFIRLPDECSLTRTTTATRNEHQCLVIDHHLLEFKGYPCVARSEKIMIRRSRHHRHRRHRSHHRSHPRKGQRSSFCCCGFKVHLFVLEDKVNQVWIKEETFHLQIKEEGLLPAPFCCYFDATITLPTRILSFSDQLLLYWTDGEYLLLYNLQMKYLKVVKFIGRKTHPIDGDVFETKMKKGIPPGRIIGDDDNIYFPYMDYQLHAQPENILSLKSFIPEGREHRKFCSHWDFEQSMKNGKNKEPAGYLCTPRELVRYHAFY